MKPKDNTIRDINARWEKDYGDFKDRNVCRVGIEYHSGWADVSGTLIMLTKPNTSIPEPVQESIPYCFAAEMGDSMHTYDKLFSDTVSVLPPAVQELVDEVVFIETNGAIDVGDVSSVAELHGLLKKALKLPMTPAPEKMDWTTFAEQAALSRLPEKLTFEGWESFEKKFPDDSAAMKNALAVLYRKKYPNMPIDLLLCGMKF